MARKKLGIGIVEINKKFKDKEEAYKYIDILRKKYNIKVLDLSVEGKYYYNDNLFKVIYINSKRAVEKSKIIFLELNN